MGKKKSKKKKGEGAKKTLEKTARNELKALKKQHGEDDIDLLLRDLQKSDQAKTAVRIDTCPEGPTPRSNGTWLAHPNKNEIILFGGELYNGQTTSVYNDLFLSERTHKRTHTHTVARTPIQSSICSRSFSSCLCFSPSATTLLRRSGRRCPPRTVPRLAVRTKP
jgi:hypothetical protein